MIGCYVSLTFHAHTHPLILLQGKMLTFDESAKLEALIVKKVRHMLEKDEKLPPSHHNPQGAFEDILSFLDQIRSNFGLYESSLYIAV